MTNLEQISNKYGVPTPKTCKELDWQNETLFSWYYDKASEQFILITKDGVDLGLNFVANAPQVHEIMSKMPKYIFHNGFTYSLQISKDSVCYTTNEFKCLYGASIGNIYEILPKLYIKLRKENLL